MTASEKQKLKPRQLKLIVLEIIKAKPSEEGQLLKIMRTAAGKFTCPPPQKSDLLSAYHSLLKSKKIKKDEKLEKMLIKRGVRSLSGVAVISLLTKHHSCPGKCLYCPTEKDMPKSYLSNEPAVMRAILNDFDPYRQIKMRLRALEANGHSTEKIELIIMGGTWSCHAPQYQGWFIKRCYEALNGRRAKNLESAQKTNEMAKHRCIGLTLETRPDYINEEEIIRMRKYGCTRVELGIQHIDDKILKVNLRGHNSKTSTEAITLLKQAGFKINYHLMTGLPGSTPAKDLAMFRKLYTHPDWMPDMIKLYPTVVTKNSQLYKWWKSGKYKPYSDKQLENLLIKIKKITPEFVRITRLIRDIPKESIVAGNKITNLRQLLQNRSKTENWQCKCIRCREIGHQEKDVKLTKPVLNIKKFEANDGTEYFISITSKNKQVLYAFLRLRINDDQSIFIPELSGAAIIRELHTYGKAAAIGQTGKVQHTGFGKQLIAEAEKICKKNKISKLAVISGVGVRTYYKKLGYKPANTYMIKGLD